MASELNRRKFLGTAGTVAAGTAATGVGLAADSARTTSGEPIKIIGICGSPRKGKSTAAALEICLDAARKVADNIQVELIELAGMAINGSVAAGLPVPEGHPDDFPKLVPKLSDPKVRGIIIGTPVYYGNMTSLCKAFLERCMEFQRNNTWSDKVAGVLAVGGSRNGGQELTIQSVQAVLFCHQMLLVGDGKPTRHRGATLWSGAPGGVAKDEYGISTARNLGRRVAEVALRMGG